MHEHELRTAVSTFREMRVSMGQLLVAVESLNEQLRGYGKQLDAVREDVNAARAYCKILSWRAGAAGILLSVYLAIHFRRILWP